MRLAMIKQRYLLTITIFLSTMLCIGCSLSVSNFTKDQLTWFQPFSRTDTAVFKSTNNELDTIIFDKTHLDRDTVRNFIELGYYSTNYLSVPYRFTKGSYHQFAFMGDGKNRYDQSLFSLSKSSNNQEQFEIIFIGTIFNGKELKNSIKLNSEVYYFDSKKATYSGMNVEKAINDFTFDKRAGIIKYTDERNIVWKRLAK